MPGEHGEQSEVSGPSSPQETRSKSKLCCLQPMTAPLSPEPTPERRTRPACFPELPLLWHWWALQRQWEWARQMSSPDREAHLRRGRRERSRACLHWVPGPLPRRCRAHQVGLRGEGRGAWKRGDVMEPRAGWGGEGGRGDEGSALGRWPHRRAEAASLAGRGKGVSLLHLPFHPHTPELVSQLSYWLPRG